MHCLDPARNALIDLRKVMFAALGLPTFLHTVSRVIGVSSEEKVVGINTRWHIASMQDAHTARDWTHIHFPCLTMGVNNFGFSRPDLECAVSKLILSGASPYPATSFRNRSKLALKTILHRSSRLW